jgi:16S rRNA (cytidine1402-2'-O)-methyltransferase
VKARCDQVNIKHIILQNFQKRALFCEAKDLEMAQSKFQTGLYIVATPIGNLGDLAPRAVSLLSQANLIAVENTQMFRQLGVEVPTNQLMHVTEHNTFKKIPEILAIAQTGIAVLTSDAGTPAISDPGSRIVEAAHKERVPVYAIPGPSALAAAISISGFSGDAHFLGFLPRKKNARLTLLKKTAQTAKMLVIYESPVRLIRTLLEIADWLDDPEAVICREITKIHEETIREKASILSKQLKKLRGECTIVVNCEKYPVIKHLEQDASEYLREMHRAGAKRSGAASEAARRFNIERALAYSLWPENNQA